MRQNHPHAWGPTRHGVPGILVSFLPLKWKGVLVPTGSGRGSPLHSLHPQRYITPMGPSKTSKGTNSLVRPQV